MHALQLNYRGNGRRAPWHHERGTQRPRATLTLKYNNTTTILLQDPRDTKGTGRHTGGSRETPEGPGGTRGMQEAPGGTERQHGGIRATGTQQQY
jgi:hypothetical protein